MQLRFYSLRVTDAPEIEKALTGKKVVQLSSSAAHHSVVTSNGRLWLWGGNEQKQLGLAPDNPEYSVRVRPSPKALHLPHRIKMVSCGTEHTLAFTHKGEVLAWGANDCGQLGNGSVSNPADVKSKRYLAPAIVEHISPPKHDYHVVSVVAGASCSAAMDTSGALWLWGDGDMGQVGEHKNHLRSLLCQFLPAFATKHSLTHSLFLHSFLTTNQMGNGKTPPTAKNPLPMVVPAANFPGRLATDKINHVAFGDHHVICSSAAGKLWAWGSNAAGQLGLGKTDTQVAMHATPHLVVGMQSHPAVKQVCAGSHTSLCLTIAGKVYGFGDAVYCQLGADESKVAAAKAAKTPLPVFEPKEVKFAANAFKQQVLIEYIAVSGNNCCALSDKGVIYAWGASPAFSSTKPTQIEGWRKEGVAAATIALGGGTVMITTKDSSKDRKKRRIKGRIQSMMLTNRLQVSGANALVTFICDFCILRTQLSRSICISHDINDDNNKNLTINMHLYTHTHYSACYLLRAGPRRR
jgi:alpha-tubulin suppressor-like RCC1 family protein